MPTPRPLDRDLERALLVRRLSARIQNINAQSMKDLAVLRLLQGQDKPSPAVCLMFRMQDIDASERRPRNSDRKVGVML